MEEGRRIEEEEGSGIVLLGSFGGEGFGVVLVDKNVTIELGGASTD